MQKVHLFLGSSGVFELDVRPLSGRPESLLLPGTGHEKTRLQLLPQTGLAGGSYRDRTDDIHGVNVALYQLS